MNLRIAFSSVAVSFALALALIFAGKDYWAIVAGAAFGWSMSSLLMAVRSQRS